MVVGRRRRQCLSVVQQIHSRQSDGNSACHWRADPQRGVAISSEFDSERQLRSQARALPSERRSDDRRGPATRRSSHAKRYRLQTAFLRAAVKRESDGLQTHAIGAVDRRASDHATRSKHQPSQRGAVVRVLRQLGQSGTGLPELQQADADRIEHRHARDAGFAVWRGAVFSVEVKANDGR